MVLLIPPVILKKQLRSLPHFYIH